MSQIQPQPSGTYLLPTAVRELRKEIEQHGGNEVFFVGQRGEATGKVQTVEAICRGHGTAVPAILNAARPGDVVIHNHPSGHLVPSEPDLALACQYGDNDVGFLIVNNAVDAVVAVVKPAEKREQQIVDAAALDRVLGPRGELASRLPNYEWRPGQLEMSRAVLNIFNRNRLGLIEAGTGTGKSLAYLVPAALCALANKDVVVVATHTINLQEQLFFKDAPQVVAMKAMDGLKVALLKGRSNYLCNRKFDYYKQLPVDMFASEEQEILRDLEAWYHNTATGSRTELTFHTPADIWERVASDESDCTRVKCPEYEACFFFRARREAAGAHILIANQHLVMADLSIRHTIGDYKRALVLPAFRRLILDEAHHLEEVATSFASARVSSRGINRLLNRIIAPPRGRRRTLSVGVISILMSRMASKRVTGQGKVRIEQIVRERLENRVTSSRRASTDYLGEIGVRLEELFAVRGGRANRQLRVLPPFLESELWTDVIKERLEELQHLFSLLATDIGSLVDAWKALPEEFRKQEQQLGLELGALRPKLVSYAARLQKFLKGGDNIVRWLELEKSGSEYGPRAAICTSPIEVAELLHEMVFEPMKTVLLTSATLSTAEGFDYLKHRVGLNRGPPQRLLESNIASPFDYRRQVYFGIPKDFPDPRRPEFADRLTDFLERAILISGGGAFVLFTSYMLLNRVYEAILARGRLPFQLLKQGSGPRHQLLSRFKADTNAVLLGTSSFWEGVDVQGEALRLVAIPKLPFQVPSDPVQEARAEAVTARGGDPFREISLPQAVLQFKQGFGRLIRRHDDRGTVLVLDPRIVGKYYGRHFLEAVRGIAPAVGGTDEVLTSLERFFALEDRSCDEVISFTRDGATESLAADSGPKWQERRR